MFFVVCGRVLLVAISRASKVDLDGQPEFSSGFEIDSTSAMQTADLFSFLDEDENAADQPQPERVAKDVTMEDDESLPPKMRKKKRKAAEAAMAAALGDGRTSGGSLATITQIHDDEMDRDEFFTEPTFKKPRLASPQPVVVDEFQTEAKREVAASAGLTGTVEAGQRLELRHQVRGNLSQVVYMLNRMARSATKWPFLQAILTSPYLNTSLQKSRSECIHLHLIRSSRSPSMPLSEERACLSRPIPAPVKQSWPNTPLLSVYETSNVSFIQVP